MKSFASLCLVMLVAMLPLHSAGASPLFDDNSVLAVTLEGPVTTLARERSKTDELSFTLTFLQDDGSPQSADVRLRTRGNFRHDRKTCPFPPVRINFKKRHVKNTVFHKQDKLKLVTHCRNKVPANRNALQREYLAYRVFNALTDASFRVRMLEITWVDTDKDNRSMTQYGFVIEDVDALAKRIGRKELNVPATTVAELDPEYTNLMSVFQYFVANTDFSPVAAAPGENCCHNGKLLRKRDAGIYAVPYDFDMSGFVDAPYATPNPRFKLRSVKQRLYRGRCVNNEYLQSTFEQFREQRQAIEALIDGHVLLDERERKSTLRFIAAFYETIDNPKDVDRLIIGRCLS